MLSGGSLIPDFVNEYHPGALAIQRGEGYVDPSEQLIAKAPPVYSLFISPWVVEDVSESVEALRPVAGCLSFVWVIVVAWLAKMTVPRVSIMVVLPLAVLWPPLAALGNPMFSELLFAFMITVAVALVVLLSRFSRGSPYKSVLLALAIGLTLGMASLTKITGLAVGAAIIFAVVVSFHSWSFRRRAGIALCVLVVSSAAQLPWVLYYQDKTGSSGYPSRGPLAIQDGLTQYPSFPAGAELIRRSHWDDSLQDISKVVREVSREYPMGMGRIVAMKLFQAWYATHSGRYDIYLLPLQLPWFLLFVFSCFRTLWRWRRIPPEIIIQHGVVVALWLMSAMVRSNFRYLAPAFPMVVLIVCWQTGDILRGLLSREPTL
jgi:4-amino-4-deoxy-L-arabinose transferase-like glycosyltransferase